MTKGDTLAEIVGRAVSLYPHEVATILEKTGVMVGHPNMDSKNLVSLTIDGLYGNEVFVKEFAEFVESNKDII